MELKEGFHQTELGPLPKEWDLVFLPNVCWFQEGPGLRQWQFKKSGMKVINVTNLEGGFLNLDRTDRHISHQEFNKTYKHFDIDPADIVMASSGNSYSKTSVVRHQDLPLMMNTSVIRFKPANGMDYNYLFSFLTSYLFKEQIDLMITGGAQPNFGPFHLRRVQVPLPNQDEQRAIATALSDVDALIASLDKLIAKKRAIKTATMQQLLTGKRRLPGFGGEWEVKRLGDVSWPRKERFDPRKMGNHEFCVELEHVEQGTGNLLGFTTAREGASLKTVFQPSDVLFGKLRAYLRKYWLATMEGVCSTEIWALVANRKLIVPSFLYQLVKTDKFIEAASEAYGTHMPRSDWKVVKGFEVALPSIDEQAEIATILSDMDTEITALEARRDKSRAIKQGMMQELLTGRTRLI